MQSRARTTRTSIIDGAARAVVASGIGVSINDIVAESETTKGSVYFHFSSRSDVLVAISNDAHDRYTALPAPKLGAHPADAATRLVLDYVRAANCDVVLQADALLWTDPVLGKNARAGIYAELRAALVAALTTEEATATQCAADIADTVMLALTGLTAQADPGAPAPAENSTERLLAVILTAAR